MVGFLGLFDQACLMTCVQFNIGLGHRRCEKGKSPDTLLSSTSPLRLLVDPRHRCCCPHLPLPLLTAPHFTPVLTFRCWCARQVLSPSLPLDHPSSTSDRPNFSSVQEHIPVYLITQSVDRSYVCRSPCGHHPGRVHSHCLEACASQLARLVKRIQL